MDDGAEAQILSYLVHIITLNKTKRKERQNFSLLFIFRALPIASYCFLCFTGINLVQENSIILHFDYFL